MTACTFLLVYVAFSSLNFPGENRRRQVLMPLVLLVFLLSALVIYFSNQLSLPWLRALSGKPLVEALHSFFASAFFSTISGHTRNPEIRTTVFVLLLFFAVKAVGILLFALLALLEKISPEENSGKTSDWFYKKDPNGAWILKEHWHFPHRFFLYLGRMGWVVFLVQFWLASTWPGFDAYPGHFFPLLIGVFSLLFLECAWLLGGTPSVAHGETGKDAVKKTGKQALVFEKLQKKYVSSEKGWGDWLLIHAARFFPAVKDACEQDGPVSPAKISRKSSVWFSLMEENFRNRGSELSETQRGLARNLFEKKDVILQASAFHQASPILLVHILRLLAEKRRVLVLVDEDKYGGYPAIEHCIVYFRKEMQNLWGSDGNFWRIGRLEDDMGTTRRPHVVVAGTRDLLRWRGDAASLFSAFDFVVVLDLSTVASRLSELSILADLLRHHNQVQGRKPPQFLFFNHDERRWESSLRSYLGLNPEEYVLVPDHTGEAVSETILCFQSEAVPAGNSGRFRRMQDVLFQYRANMGTLPVLILPALREGLHRIVVAECGLMPWEDLREEILRAQANMKDKTYAKLLLPKYGEFSSTDTLQQVWLTAFPWLSEDRSGEDLALYAHDSQCNISTALGAMLRVSAKNRLLVLVSPPYILRNYLADQFEKFEENPVLAIAPRLIPGGLENLCYRLLELLDRGWVQGRVLVDLLRSGAKNADMEVRLQKLFFEVMGLDILKENLLRVEKRQGDPLQGNHGPSGAWFYRLDLKFMGVSGRRRLRWMQFFRLMDGTSTIGEERFDAIQHTCLPEQIRICGGKSYKVDRIDMDREVVHLKHVDNAPCMPAYRILRTVCLKEPSFSSQTRTEKERRGWVLRRFVLKGSFCIRTTGYCSFPNGKPDLDGQVTFHRIDGEYPGGKEALGTRDFISGRGMLLNALPPEDFETESAACLLPWLALLLNEAFYTLFPEYPIHILACPILDGTGVGTYRGGTPASPPDLVPVMPEPYTLSVEGEKILGLSILFLEDAYRDMGLVQGLYDRWETVARLLDDYLGWLSSDSSKEKDVFLGFGRGSDSPAPASDLLALLDPWLDSRMNPVLQQQSVKKKAAKIKTEAEKKKSVVHEITQMRMQRKKKK